MDTQNHKAIALCMPTLIYSIVLVSLQPCKVLYAWYLQEIFKPGAHLVSFVQKVSMYVCVCLWMCLSQCVHSWAMNKQLNNPLLCSLFSSYDNAIDNKKRINCSVKFKDFYKAVLKAD